MLRQIEAATVGLKAIGDPESDEAVHDARRRVKKIRAVIRLVRPALGKTSRAVDKDLRDVSRLLAPVADGQGIIVTLDALERRYNRLLPRTLVASLRTRLIDRGSQTDRQADSDHVLQAAAGTLESSAAASSTGSCGRTASPRSHPVSRPASGGREKRCSRPGTVRPATTITRGGDT